MNNISKLLINENPLQVLPTLAALIGLNEAIILQQVHYWLNIAQKSKDTRKKKDGKWWVYNTYKDWKENFPWWSVDTIKRTINRLEEAGLLLSVKHNASDWDHTKWYSIDYEMLNALYDECILPQSMDAESDERTGQDALNLNKNPETSSKTTTDTDELIDLFAKITKLEIPLDGRKRPAFYWREPIDQIGDALEWDKKKTSGIIGTVVKEMDESGLTISSPKSILKTTMAKIARMKRNGNNAGAPGAFVP